MWDLFTEHVTAVLPVPWIQYVMSIPGSVHVKVMRMDCSAQHVKRTVSTSRKIIQMDARNVSVTDTWVEVVFLPQDSVQI